MAMAFPWLSWYRQTQSAQTSRDHQCVFVITVHLKNNLLVRASNSLFEFNSVFNIYTSLHYNYSILPCLSWIQLWKPSSVHFYQRFMVKPSKNHFFCGEANFSIVWLAFQKLPVSVFNRSIHHQQLWHFNYFSYFCSNLRQFWETKKIEKGLIAILWQISVVAYICEILCNKWFLFLLFDDTELCHGLAVVILV